MARRLMNIMKTGMAIVLTIGLLATSIVISSLIDFDVAWIMVLGTTLWAAIDSSRIQFKRYKGCVGPIRLFITCGLLWIVGFPWYLAKRDKIMKGKAVLKDEARSAPAESIACVSCGTTIPGTANTCPKCGWSYAVTCRSYLKGTQDEQAQAYMPALPPTC